MSLFEGKLKVSNSYPKGFGGYAPSRSRFLVRASGWKTQKQGRTLHVERSLKAGVQIPGVVEEDRAASDLCEESSPGSLGEKEDAAGSDRVSRVFWVACSASIMAAASRTSFSVLAIPIQERFALSMADMGLIQSSLLFGYIVGQVLCLFVCVNCMYRAFIKGSVMRYHHYDGGIYISNMMFLFEDARGNACCGWQMHRCCLLAVWLTALTCLHRFAVDSSRSASR